MARSSRTGAHPGLRLAALRRFHLWIGVFIAPSLLFFACTGALQLFSLHEAHDSYTPPPLIEGLAKVHKDQVFAVEKPEVGKADHADHPHHHDEAPKATTIALKWFFLAVACGLIVSTSLGLWMALVASRDRAVAWVLLLAGAVIPIALVIL
jgi:hypothetical protein